MSSSPSSDFLAAVQERRTYYTINDKSPIPDSKIVEIIQFALKHAPSSFNSQTSRVVVVFGQEHIDVWDIVLECVKVVAPPEVFPSTIKKVDACFKAGHGTILFFEDQAAIKAMEDAFPLYQKSFAGWAQETSCLIQFICWTALEKEGLGGSLQHYNPLIDEKIKSKFNLPATWFLTAQMPFGTPTAPASEKTFMVMEERFKVFGL